MSKFLGKLAGTLFIIFAGVQGWSAANFLLNQKDDLMVFLGTLVVAVLVCMVPYSIFSVWRQNEATDHG
jgi:hypothetical protein